ncbi:MAG: dihydrofolate reductase [Clostridia bacterium]|nr:dihydrofolate reductase [Clostridia bacterium]
MICVVDSRWGVGREEALLFYIPADMRFFKETTTGNVVVMGSNTLRSFPRQQPLKDRVNIVLSETEIDTPGVICCTSMDDLMEEISRYDPDSVFLIGGASMYDQLMDCCTDALITRVDAVGDADREIQSLDDREGWELVEVSEPMEDNGFRFVFTRYVNHNVRENPTPLDTLIAEAEESGVQAAVGVIDVDGNAEAVEVTAEEAAVDPEKEAAEIADLLAAVQAMGQAAGADAIEVSSGGEDDDETEEDSTW